MLIRPYENRDGRAVRTLFIRVNRDIAPAAMRQKFETYIEQSLKEEIERIPEYYAEHGGGFFVAERAGSLVGMYGLESREASVAELRRMYVAPEARRSGVGRALLKDAEERCRADGFEVLILSTSELQKEALALYRSAAFELVREEIAVSRTNKQVGSGLRRFHFRKALR
jgi:GNAT superfamily N-acetyltransferase